jgi:hypothetical protein
MNHNCEALGVCQHQDRECIGACEAKPALPVWFVGDEPGLFTHADATIYRVVFGAAALVSLVALCGTAGYLYVRFFS